MFNRLIEYIERSENRELEIRRIAYWLHYYGMEEGKSWATLALQFFKYYRPELDRWYGVDGILDRKSLVVVKDQRLLIDFMGGMKKAGFIPFASYPEVAGALKSGFDISLSEKQLERKLKEADGYLFDEYLKTSKRIYLPENQKK